MVTAMRPHGFAGNPLALLPSNSFQVAPPSVVWKKLLPLGAVAFSPPERKVQPFRRKSHMPAKRLDFSFGRRECHRAERQQFFPDHGWRSHLERIGWQERQRVTRETVG